MKLDNAINEMVSEVNLSWDKKEKRKKGLTAKAKKGLIPMVVYKDRYDTHKALVFRREFNVWDWVDTREPEAVERLNIFSCVMKPEDMRFDHSGEVAKQLNEFNKERRKILRAEQRYLKTAFLLGKRAIPKLEGVR